MTTETPDSTDVFAATAEETQFSQLGLQSRRNSNANLEYYTRLSDFFQEDSSEILTKLFSFPVYVPRQVLEDFLARYELFRMIEAIQGDILEFGTFNGAGCFSFAHFSAIKEPQNLTRKVVTFDTFEGFPNVSEQDKKGNPDLVKKGGLRSQPLDRLQRAREIWDLNRFISHIPRLEFVQGNIMETLDEYLINNPQTLPALVYLDVDLFEPTAHCLKRLLPRMQKGSIIAFDELNHSAFPGETVAFLQEMNVTCTTVRRVPFSSRISYVTVGE